MRVISSIRLGLFRNHQQPNTIRLPNFRAVTASSCWFSRASMVTKNLFFGNCRQRFWSETMSDFASASPPSRRSGFTFKRLPIIIAKGNPRSAQTGSTTCSSIVCPARATASAGSAG